MDPYVMEVESDHNNNSMQRRYNTEGDDGVQYEGYIIDLMSQIASLVGFNYRISIVQDGRYGFRKSDGTWNGMIGQLMRKVRCLRGRGNLYGSTLRSLKLVYESSW